MGIFGRRSEQADTTPLRDQMTRDDPDFAHVRDVQHRAQGLIGASQNAQQLKDRFQERVRQSWGQGGA